MNRITKILSVFALSLIACLTSINAAEKTVPAVQTSVLDQENLVAWCIVPFDASKRTPEQRAIMLKELGLKKCAYDWRAQHVEEFEQEILSYQKHGIEFFAFWGEHPKAFELFEKYDLKPQIWRMMSQPNAETQQQKVDQAVNSILPLVKKTQTLQLSLGIYNHGGWSGEPENLVAVCEKLHQLGYGHVGIVYNFHHAHDRIADWEVSLQLMLPYLHCLNINGMNDHAKPKILGLGQGQYERSMIQSILTSGYSGPIGILDHRSELDAKKSLQENLEGLDVIKREMLSTGENQK